MNFNAFVVIHIVSFNAFTTFSTPHLIVNFKAFTRSESAKADPRDQLDSLSILICDS